MDNFVFIGPFILTIHPQSDWTFVAQGLSQPPNDGSM
jgi:hypothetical protein